MGEDQDAVRAPGRAPRQRAPHVLVTCREGLVYGKSRSDEPEVVGLKPEIYRSWLSLFDVVGRMAMDNGVRVLTLEKNRYATDLALTIKNPSPRVFAFAAGVRGEGKALTAPGDMARLEADAEVSEPATPETVEAIEVGTRELLRRDPGPRRGVRPRVRETPGGARCGPGHGRQAKMERRRREGQ